MENKIDASVKCAELEDQIIKIDNDICNLQNEIELLKAKLEQLKSNLPSGFCIDDKSKRYYLNKYIEFYKSISTNDGYPRAYVGTCYSICSSLPESLKFNEYKDYINKKTECRKFYHSGSRELDGEGYNSYIPNFSTTLEKIVSAIVVFPISMIFTHNIIISLLSGIIAGLIVGECIEYLNYKTLIEPVELAKEKLEHIFYDKEFMKKLSLEGIMHILNELNIEEDKIETLCMSLENYEPKRDKEQEKETMEKELQNQIKLKSAEIDMLKQQKHSIAQFLEYKQRQNDMHSENEKVKAKTLL